MNMFSGIKWSFSVQATVEKESLYTRVIIMSPPLVKPCAFSQYRKFLCQIIFQTHVLIILSLKIKSSQTFI